MLEEELKSLIKERFGSVPKFAAHIDVPPTSVYGALSRGMQNTRTELTDKIYKGLNVDMNTVSFDESKELKLLDETGAAVTAPVLKFADDRQSEINYYFMRMSEDEKDLALKLVRAIGEDA